MYGYLICNDNEAEVGTRTIDMHSPWRRRLIAVALVCVAAFAGIYLGFRSLRNPLDPRIVEADNDFGFKLFKQLLKEDPNRNILICPVGIALALQLTYNGATGETRQDMAKTLGLEGMSLEEINRGNEKLIRMLKNRHLGVRVNIANSLLADGDTHFRPRFADVGQRIYSARFRVKEASSSSRGVKGGKPTPGTLDIVSEAQIDGGWTWDFSECMPYERWFRCPDGKEKYITMIGACGSFASISDRDHVSVKPGIPYMLRLPYEDNHTSMYIALTSRELNSKNWETWISQMRKAKIMVCFPLFKVMYEANLLDSFRALGIDLSPDQAATDLKSVSLPSPQLIQFRHDARLEVSSKGSKPLPDMRQYLPNFSTDGPFFFTIQDDRSGLILFMGWVADPTEGL